jgi:hypothetical protein
MPMSESIDDIAINLEEGDRWGLEDFMPRIDSITGKTLAAKPKKTLMELVEERINFESFREHILSGDGNLQDEDTQKFLDAWENSILDGEAQKIDAYKIKLESLEDDIEWFKKEADKFSRVARQLTNLIDAMKVRIKVAMLALDKKEMLGVRYKVSLSRARASVKIIDKDKLPKEFIETRVVSAPKTKELYEELKAGVDVPGAYLEENYALRFGIIKGK